MIASCVFRFILTEPVIENGKAFKARIRAAVMEPVKYVDALNGQVCHATNIISFCMLCLGKTSKTKNMQRHQSGLAFLKKQAKEGCES